MVLLAGFSLSFLFGFGHFVVCILLCYVPVRDIVLSHSSLDDLFGSVHEVSVEVSDYFVYVPSLHGICLFVHSRMSNFSYLVAVTITGDRAANLDLC
jgi:hypothetical protein